MTHPLAVLVRAVVEDAVVFQCDRIRPTAYPSVSVDVLMNKSNLPVLLIEVADRLASRAT